jgi:hypothetical protein
MKHFLPAALLFTALGGCNDKGPGPSPPELYGSTWDLSARTLAITDATGTTTTTTAVPSGSFSIAYPGDGTYRLLTGGATATGKCEYDGKTITIYNTVGFGAAQTRVMTVSALTATQLVTVEKTQDSGSSYTSTDTYTRL